MDVVQIHQPQRRTDEHRRARRAFQRWPLDADVQVLAPVHATGIALNVSAGGLRVALDRPMTVGQRCRARIKTSETHEVIELTRIVWSRRQPDGWVVGMQFLDEA